VQTNPSTSNFSRCCTTEEHAAGTRRGSSPCWTRVVRINGVMHERTAPPNHREHTEFHIHALHMRHVESNADGQA